MKTLITLVSGAAIILIATYASVVIGVRIFAWVVSRRPPMAPRLGPRRLNVKTWMDAAGRLMKDPSAEVRCPNCGAGRLVMRDGALLPGDPPRFERLIACPECKVKDFCLFYPATGEGDSEQAG